MGKEINYFYKNCEENSRPSELIISKRKNLMLDNKEAEVYRVNVSVEMDNKSRKIGRMILKEPHDIELNCIDNPEAAPENIINKYLKLKSIGAPVVPTLRYDKENECFLMTDMTENGKNIIIDKHNPYTNSEIEIININEIRQEARELAEKTWNNEIFLYSDAYAVTVNKETGFGKLCVLDIGQMSYLINHNHCLIFDTKEDAVNNANVFIKYDLTKR